MLKIHLYELSFIQLASVKLARILKDVAYAMSRVIDQSTAHSGPTWMDSSDCSDLFRDSACDTVPRGRDIGGL